LGKEVRIKLSDGNVVKVTIKGKVIKAQLGSKEVKIDIENIPLIEAALTAYYREKLLEAGKNILESVKDRNETHN